MFDFTEVIDRTGHDSIAFDAKGAIAGGSLGPKETMVREGFDPIPMWVADMSFGTAPSVLQAMRKRIEHPCFGYFDPPSEYYQSIAWWHEVRKGMPGIESVHIGYENGVLGGVANALGVLCSRGDRVLVHSPTYTGFTNTLRNAGYELVSSSLVRDDLGVWRMDYEDMERKIVTGGIHAAILCSPHNPTGRVWEQDELERAMELFTKHDVYVIADEIWSDILLDGSRHIPAQTVSEDARRRTVSLYAPSKTFNLAGLVGSYRVVFNPWLRDRLARQASLTHYNNQNVLSMHALMGAYSQEGAVWLDALLDVLSKNAGIASGYFASVPGVSFARPQGTYMLFIDCSQWCDRHAETIDDVLRRGVEVGVLWQDGRAFGGDATIRMNLALPESRLRDALQRLDTYVFAE